MADAVLFSHAAPPIRIGTLAPDGLIKETFEREATTTTHAREDGSTIRDHRVKKRPNPTITVIVSDSAATSGAQGEPGKAQALLEQLTEIWDKGTLIDVVAGLAIYNQVTLDKIRSEISSSEGRSVRTIDLTFSQVPTVSTANVKASSGGKRTQGKKTPTETQQAKTDAPAVKSTLKAAGEAFGVFLRK